MSNERVIKAAEAVEDLRKALELWCTRDDAAGSPLGVRSAANEAVDSIDTALHALHEIRSETITQVRRYDDASTARVDALLAAVRPPASPPGLRADVEPLPVDDNPEAADYKCADCGQVFVVDPTDPIESHGAYLDHMAEHDDAEDDERDKASEAAR